MAPELRLVTYRYTLGCCPRPCRRSPLSGDCAVRTQAVAGTRLAMQVEDHPVSYFHFEGIIPPDNYGAGTVMVWDTGTWEPLQEDYSDHKKNRAEREKEALTMVAKGDLKFRLHGEKLKGD